MFNRAVDNCAHALEFVLECCKTQEMCDKAVVLAILYLIPYLIDIRLKKRVIQTLTMLTLMMIILIKKVLRLMAWRNRFKKDKACKKISKELMSVTQHSARWWNLCMSEDEKKKQNHF